MNPHLPSLQVQLALPRCLGLGLLGWCSCLGGCGRISVDLGLQHTRGEGVHDSEGRAGWEGSAWVCKWHGKKWAVSWAGGVGGCGRGRELAFRGSVTG